jgi:hypothetical protein
LMLLLPMLIKKLFRIILMNKILPCQKSKAFISDFFLYYAYILCANFSFLFMFTYGVVLLPFFLIQRDENKILDMFEKHN